MMHMGPLDTSVTSEALVRNSQIIVEYGVHMAPTHNLVVGRSSHVARHSPTHCDVAAATGAPGKYYFAAPAAALVHHVGVPVESIIDTLTYM